MNMKIGIKYLNWQITDEKHISKRECLCSLFLYKKSNSREKTHIKSVVFSDVFCVKGGK